MSVATIIRIGNRLGAGEGIEARQAGQCSMAILGVFALGCAVASWLTRFDSPNLYTADQEVLSMSAETIRIFSVYLVFSCGIWGIRASLNGCAKQPVSAKIAIASAYLVGIPSAALCCFGLGWGLNGLWCGLTAGNTAAVLLLLHNVGRIDWPLEAGKARERSGRAAAARRPEAAEEDGDDEEEGAAEEEEEGKALLGGERQSSSGK